MDKDNNLVDDCLRIIFNKLQNREDQNSFGLTCKQWFRIRNSTRKLLFFGQGLNSKDSKELSSNLPKIVSRYSSLSSISLYNCAELTNSTLNKSKISGSNLKTLSLNGCKKVSDKFLAKYFAGCPNLVTLNLDSCNVTNYVLKLLSNSLHSLRNISLSNCNNISDHGITSLFKGCPNINALNISHCKGIKGFGFKNCPSSMTDIIADSCWFSSRGILEVFRVKKLEYLSLNNVREIRVFNEDIKVNAKALKFLNLSNCDFLSCSSLAAIIRGSPLLEELNLSECDEIVSNEWTELAPNCKNFRVLNANGCGYLYSEGLLSLAGCEKLEIIYIRDCCGIEDHVEKFQALRPDVIVSRDECLSLGPCISGLFA
ncbi:hypothetical protein LUZ60_007608 [Juncus effusus]|nr:hypothetical protein LUZ60_007608 [Juncus effusus]